MKSSAQVVVIGGGVVGASVLYHLTKAGWTDVMLLERRELTAGSTWHAAGGMHTLNGDPNVSKLQQYTIQLYEEIERISGQDCSIHLPGGLMLADTEVRMDFLRMAVARGRYLGMDLELISSKEAADLFPLLDPQYFVGALYDPVEGHVDPTGVTHAYVKSAQIAGAEVHQHTPVVGLSQRPDGTWDVRVESGDVDPRRARRQRRRAVGARGRPDGRDRAAGPRHGAHLPHHPGHARGRRPRRQDRPRDADGARLRRRDLHPPGGRRDAARHVRAGMRAVVAARDAVGLRLAAAQAGHRPHHARARGRVPALPGDGHDRDPAHRQRAVHVLTRRQSAGRTDPRPARLLGRLRGDGRAVAGRRRRAGAGHLDDRRRPRRFRDGYLGDGRRPLRRLRDAGLHERQGPGELPPPVPDHLPERGAARRAAAADDADLRPADGRQRGLGRDLRSRARAVVPGEGARAEGGGHLPSLERVVAGRRRGRRRARAGRHDRDLQLRQVPGDRPRRRGLAVVAADRADAGARADHADARCSTTRAGSSGSSRSRARARPTSSTCSGRCRPRSTTRAGSAITCRPTGPCRFEVLGARARRVVGRRAACARRPPGDRARPGPVDRGVPVHDVPAGRPRDDAGPPRAGSTTRATSATSCGSRRSTSASCSTGSWRPASRTACGCSGCAR